MFFNLSRSPLASWCIEFTGNRFNNVSNSSSTHYQVTLAACVVTALLAPLAVAGNAFILAAIWRNPSLRTPSYVLLAGLAVTDFCTGLLTQPFFVMYKTAEITGKRKMYCIGGLLTESTALFFSTLSFFVITMIAVERWLHMSRRSLLTVRRVVIVYITLVVVQIFGVGFRMYSWNNPSKAFNVVVVLFFLTGAICVILTAFSYFKVFRIIRHHQNQVQTNQGSIDMQKYKKSIFTILYILAVFVSSYIPYVCCAIVFHILQVFGKLSLATLNLCTAVVLSSSFFNPLLYYWRIKEIRDGVRSIIRKVFCKQSEDES